METSLEFVKEWKKEDWAPLIKIIDEKLSASLTEAMKEDPCTHADQIIHELQLFAGNSIANLFRDTGPSYKEMLYDAAKKIGVKGVSAEMSVETIEKMLVETALTTVFDQMSQKEKEEFLLAMSQENIVRFSKDDIVHYSTLAGQAFITALLKTGGIQAYYALNKVLVWIFNTILRTTAPRWLVFGGLQRILGVFAGPVGWAIMSLWTVYDIAGPAYTVTVPACIYIAAMRQAQKGGVATH
jgi:uncharacterized protein YaaW (UPF0174 family)